jgi:hypothetical protein
MTFTFDIYNKDSVVLYLEKGQLTGKYNPHSAEINRMGGKWNNKLKGKQQGWVFPNSSAEQVKAFLHKLSTDTKLVEIKTHVKSRREQHKYHRAISDDEDEGEDDEKEGVEVGVETERDPKVKDAIGVANDAAIAQVVVACHNFTKSPPREKRKGKSPSIFPQYEQSKEKIDKPSKSEKASSSKSEKVCGGKDTDEVSELMTQLQQMRDMISSIEKRCAPRNAKPSV